MFCKWNWGPCFIGVTYSELCAYDEPLNGDGNCLSYANSPGYGIPIDKDGINLLTNKKDKKFTISELEVWEITGYMEKKIVDEFFKLK